MVWKLERRARGLCSRQISAVGYVLERRDIVVIIAELQEMIAKAFWQAMSLDVIVKPAKML